MKKTIQFLILLIFSSNILSAQQIISETEKLASLGKMYGYLKYYHPEVGKGKFNWDQEFIKYLPQILNTTDKQSLSTIYINWIESLGNINFCKKCDSEELYFDKNFDLSWTQDTILFSKPLTGKLKYIENNRSQGENFYVSTERIGQIKVINEPVYQDFEYPNEEYRLLGLFKYWNIIEYFYPYKYLSDQDWDSVLIEMIPKFRNASNKEIYHLVIKELIAKLDDSHAWVSFDKKQIKFLPIKISDIDNQAVISGFHNDSLGKLNGLKLGDIILKINDLDIQEYTSKNLKYISGSNKNMRRRVIYNNVLNGSDSIVNLTIKRNNEIKQIEVNRYDFKDFYDQKAIKFKSINENIGYVNMENILGSDIENVFKSFENKKAIIIDLRNYPKMIFSSFSSYLNSKKRDFTKKYRPNINYPGKFIYKENLQTGKSGKPFKGKVIILVNDYSISLSEFTAMAFQTADNAITIGSQTAGADGEVVIIEYIGGYKTAFTGNGVLYPNGTETQRKGIKIDIEVKPTIEGLRQGRDEVLEKGIELASK